MRAVVQRVSQAQVTIADSSVGEIGNGIVILLGVAQGDSEADADYLAEKVAGLRIFPDGEDKMNLSVSDVGGSVMVISQFTLLGDVRHGKRPSFTDAAAPDCAKELYLYFVDQFRAKGITVATGDFQAMMSVSLTNSRAGDHPAGQQEAFLACLHSTTNVSMNERTQCS